MKKRVIIASIAISVLSATPAMAGWQQGTGADASKWWYSLDQGGYYSNGWQWIDGDHDGVSEHYYFDDQGWMLTDTVTPDGFYVNAGGARESNGQVAVMDNRNLPVVPYIDVYMDDPYVFSYVNFTMNDLVDHGDYYELKNQHIYKEVPNEYYFECAEVYSGPVYFYKNVTCSYPDTYMSWTDALADYPNKEYAFSFNGTYPWTLFEMDSKGYYKGFNMQQLP